MCNDHALEPLPAWLQEELRDTLADLAIHVIPTRCLPPLNVHSGCEHDPKRRPPSFRDLATWEASADELVQRFTVQDQEFTKDAIVIRSHLGMDMARMIFGAYSQEIQRAVREELERRARAEADRG